MDDCKFKVGDLIVPLPISDKHYSITNLDMYLARVDEIRSNRAIVITILRHKYENYVEEQFTVSTDCFEKSDEFEENVDVKPLVDKLSFDSIL